MAIMLMYFEVLGQFLNTRCQNRDLHLWRTGIRFVNTEVRNDFFFLFNSRCHACKSPAFLFLSEYKKVLHVRIITWIAQGRNELRVSECDSNFLRYTMSFQSQKKPFWGFIPKTWMGVRLPLSGELVGPG